MLSNKNDTTWYHVSLSKLHWSAISSLRPVDHSLTSQAGTLRCGLLGWSFTMRSTRAFAALRRLNFRGWQDWMKHMLPQSKKEKVEPFCDFFSEHILSETPSLSTSQPSRNKLGFGIVRWLLSRIPIKRPITALSGLLRLLSLGRGSGNWNQSGRLSSLFNLLSLWKGIGGHWGFQRFTWCTPFA